ncbi:Protein kinase domain-containing protein [Aphelenchoides besseyi]|nr:Protein kinase domain-containing protein [Aphelenchoides besseyi]
MGDDTELVEFKMGKIVCGRWKVTEKLGAGGCGAVYEVTDIQRKGYTAALKVESNNVEDGGVLKLEAEVLQKLGNCKKCVRLLHSGKRGKYRQVSGCANTWVEDVKPGNMVIGMGGRMVRKFVTKNEKSNQLSIRKARKNCLLRGTLRYCSINVHKRLEQGRVDDLWSLIYMLIELLIGLPWSSLKDEEPLQKMKETITDEKLFARCPSELLEMAKHLRTLKYEDRPNYKLLYDHLMTGVRRLNTNFSKAYDWEDEKDLEEVIDTALSITDGRKPKQKGPTQSFCEVMLIKLFDIRFHVINAMLFYERYVVYQFKRQVKAVKSLSMQDQCCLSSVFQPHVKEALHCASANQKVLNLIVKAGMQMFSNNTSFQQAYEQVRKSAGSSEHYMSKCRSTLKQIVREWSADGAGERYGCYNRVLEAIRSRYPNKMQRHNVKILVPGCGLGRLNWELLDDGFSVTGNEFSFFMILTSNFLLNCCKKGTAIDCTSDGQTLVVADCCEFQFINLEASAVVQKCSRSTHKPAHILKCHPSNENLFAAAAGPTIEFVVDGSFLTPVVQASRITDFDYDPYDENTSNTTAPVKQFIATQTERIVALEVHPTNPNVMLTSSVDNFKLWDCSNEMQPNFSSGEIFVSLDYPSNSGTENTVCLWQLNSFGNAQELRRTVSDKYVDFCWQKQEEEESDSFNYLFTYSERCGLLKHLVLSNTTNEPVEEMAIPMAQSAEDEARDQMLMFVTRGQVEIINHRNMPNDKEEDELRSSLNDPPDEVTESPRTWSSWVYAPNLNETCDLLVELRALRKFDVVGLTTNEVNFQRAAVAISFTHPALSGRIVIELRFHCNFVKNGWVLLDIVKQDSPLDSKMAADLLKKLKTECREQTKNRDGKLTVLWRALRSLPKMLQGINEMFDKTPQLSGSENGITECDETETRPFPIGYQTSEYDEHVPAPRLCGLLTVFGEPLIKFGRQSTIKSTIEEINYQERKNTRGNQVSKTHQTKKESQLSQILSPTRENERYKRRSIRPRSVLSLPPGAESTFPRSLDEFYSLVSTQHIQYLTQYVNERNVDELNVSKIELCSSFLSETRSNPEFEVHDSRRRISSITLEENMWTVVRYAPQRKELISLWQWLYEFFNTEEERSVLDANCDDRTQRTKTNKNKITKKPSESSQSMRRTKKLKNVRIDAFSPSSFHPCGREFMYYFVDFYYANFDTQTAALISCILTLLDTKQKKEHANWHSIRKVNLSSTWSQIHKRVSVFLSSHNEKNELEESMSFKQKSSRELLKTFSDLSLNSEEKFEHLTPINSFPSIGVENHSDGKMETSTDVRKNSNSEMIERDYDSYLMLNNRTADEEILQLQKFLKERLDRIRLEYATMLTRWGLLNQRAELLKFYGFGEKASFKQISRLTYCDFCDESCNGIVSICALCNHGGHVSCRYEWFKVFEQCPHLCGCRCA